MSESEVRIYDHLDEDRLAGILTAIRNIRIGIVGDVCLDIYWLADMTKSELSRETPHFPLPVTEERVAPGAGGNVAANMAALRPQKVFVVTLVGRDWRRELLLHELAKRAVDTRGVVASETRITNAYCKPMRKGFSDLQYEDPRIDFDNFRPPGEEDERHLLETLDKIAPDIDVLCVSDQYQYGCITGRVREKIRDLARRGLLVVADSRNRIREFSEIILKPNEIEAFKAVRRKGDPRTATLEEQAAIARELAEMNQAKVCMTLGEKGCIYAERHNLVRIPAWKGEPPLDICGAGDTFLAAFASALASGAEAWEAAFLGNLAAAVTIKKINMTGTASPEEIAAKYRAVRKPA